MFSKSNFELLHAWQGASRDKSNPTQNAAYRELKAAYDVTARWAQAFQQALFPDGYVVVRRRPTNQANRFNSYNWARIYPTRDAPKHLAYTVGIDATERFEFCVKLDTVHEGGRRRRIYERLRRAPDNSDSPFATVLPADRGLRLSFDQLVDWSVSAIEGWEIGYGELLSALEKASVDSPVDALRKISHFKVGGLYTRPEIALQIGRPTAKGDWETGYSEWEEEFFLFVNVGNAGRTGHDYANYWDGTELIWSAKTDRSLGQPQIEKLLSGRNPVHIFWRGAVEQPFSYAGLGTPLAVRDGNPIAVTWGCDEPTQEFQATAPAWRRGPVPVYGSIQSKKADGATSVYVMVLSGPISAVYPELAADEHIIKVGLSNDPLRRRRDLSCGLPPGGLLKWRIVNTLRFESGQGAFDAETALLEHLRRAKRWIGGEFAKVSTVELENLFRDGGLTEKEGRVALGA